MAYFFVFRNSERLIDEQINIAMETRDNLVIQSVIRAVGDLPNNSGDDYGNQVCQCYRKQKDNQRLEIGVVAKEADNGL